MRMTKGVRKQKPKDFFAIPFHKEWIIYRPLRLLAFVGNAALVQYLEGRFGNSREADTEVESFLDSVGFWEAAEVPAHEVNLDQPERPTMAVLLMTNRCNLRCTYCYANAGNSPPQDLPLNVAKRAIDAVCENAVHSQSEFFSLAFHGGGEPTVHWNVLTQAVEYARSKSLACHVSLASNGVWTEAQRQFVLHQVQNVSLSFDGIQAIQDQQRPRTDGSGSFASVMESIRSMENAGVTYGIRATAPAETLHRLPECIAFLCENTKAQAIQVEPTYTSKRGHYADMDEEYGRRFVQVFMEAFEIAAKVGRSVMYSGARPWVVTTAFCQAFTRALIVTPQGRLVTCFEIYDSDLPFAEPFVVGRVTASGVETDTKRLNRFLATQRTQRDECRDCFCYWHCCGDCASRRMVSKANTSVRCHVNQEITKEIVAWYIAQGHGVWNGRMVSHGQPITN
jgi:uncharacterized protein